MLLGKFIFIIFEKKKIHNDQFSKNALPTAYNEAKTSIINTSFSWDYWPRDDVRSPCGYVGLINLGATCYMATAMQQLYMIKEARECILKSKPSSLCSKEEDNSKGLHKYDKILLFEILSLVLV